LLPVSPVRVVAAVIERDGRFLITQRLPRATFPYHWEFPGGKVEPGEDDATALRRELTEELGVTVEVCGLLAAKVHEYPDITIDFRVYKCLMIADSIECLLCNDFRWVTMEELPGYQFPPADVDAIRLMTSELRGGDK
jgi:8-oxo-dGTP diphosphatase